MYHAKTLKQKIVLFLTILGPILVTQISYNAMTLFDTMMSGRAGTNDLAGVAIGASLWMPVSIGLNGILMAVTPMIAQLYGRGEYKGISKTVTQALYLSVVLALIVLAGGAALLNPILQAMHLDPGVYHIAKHYLIGLCIGIIPLFASNVLRYFFDAHGYTKITMTIMLFAVPFNVALNYMLIFGHFGFPRLGGIGTGYATATTYWLIFFVSAAMTFKVEAIRRYRLFIDWFAPSWKGWKEQLKIGVPMGLSVFFEASIFSMVTLLMGMMFDTVTIAAHQAAISFTTLLFMMPLSISMALTILVAYEVGGGRPEDARQYGRLGVLSAMGILGVSSVFLYMFREPIAYLYTDNVDVVTLTKQFLIFAIVYQLSDAAQASLQGVLRGYKDVTVPFVTALVAYWGVGIPVGYGLAAHTGLGPFGFWVGITIGLTLAAAGFYTRLSAIQKKRLPAAGAASVLEH
ncbi:MATE family efflux transporter [Paenibacillus doosanensis]|uniref:MATE family efflux transporter n=1 Tax=Paenibacillus doosanensis TaxID=1229154 RepID=UPI00217FDA36|nr:MATE family efflux transporter [Paenibacillus doosanensis]MCS7462353.1 MATE family efflux transporter [Paenibacillus doosanensis]